MIHRSYHASTHISTSSHFEEEGLSPDLYFMEWCMTVFCKRLDLNVVGRVWDCFLIFGEVFVYRTAVGKLLMFMSTCCECERAFESHQPLIVQSSTTNHQPTIKIIQEYCHVYNQSYWLKHSIVAWKWLILRHRLVSFGAWNWIGFVGDWFLILIDDSECYPFAHFTPPQYKIGNQWATIIWSHWPNQTHPIIERTSHSNQEKMRDWFGS